MDCPIDDDLVEGQYTDEQTLEFTQACLDQLPHDPRFFTTSLAVEDLEALRVALGYPSLNLLGTSYGTRDAQHFARRFPGSTRTVVLDGVVPPQIPLGPEIATEAQRALDDILDRCARDPACEERFPEIDLMCGPGELNQLPLLLENVVKSELVQRADRIALQGNNTRRSSAGVSSSSSGTCASKYKLPSRCPNW